MKFPVMQFSPASYQFITPKPKYSPQILFSNTFSLHSSPNVRQQVSHPYKTTEKTTHGKFQMADEKSFIGMLLQHKIYVILSTGDLLWREGALIQILDCKRQVAAFCHQLSDHCIQFFSVTMTTHNIGNVQAQLTQS
jgi:hypothetical protein